MKRNIVSLLVLFAAAGVGGMLVSQSAAQQPPETEEPAPEKIVVERQALDPVPAKTYHVSLELVPWQFLTIVAPQDGVIEDLDAEAGKSVSEGALLFEMENSEQKLLKQKAEAQVALHKLKVEQARKRKDADAEAVATAELAVADIDLKLADLRLQRTTVRAHFPSKVFQVHAREKEFVTAEQPIVDVGDDSKMRVLIPVDRKLTKVGDVVTLSVEGVDADGKITKLEAAPERFAPLRDVYESLAAAEVEIDNRSGRFLLGQTALAPLVPREPVAEIPNSAIAAGGDNQRKIQVLRHNVVRDVAVNVLAPVGDDRSFVSGAFDAEDELIVSTSVELADGTQLAREVAGEPKAASGAGPGTNQRALPGQKKPTSTKDTSGF